MKHKVITALATLAGAAALSFGGATEPVAAAGAQRVFYPEQYDETVQLSAGDGLCVPWAGTFDEVRNGGYTMMIPPGGQVPGETHITGAIAGLIELTPDDQSLPSYLPGDDDCRSHRRRRGGGVLRVGQYRVRTALRGTDGSTIGLVLSGKVTVNGTGETIVQRDQVTCS